MAVAIEFATVIVRKTAVERCFPGGLDGLASASLPNFTEDEYLVRIAFMSDSEALKLVRTLETAGVNEDEVAIVNNHDPHAVPAWLQVGGMEGTACCWLRDAPPGKLARSDCGFVLFLPLDARDALQRTIERFGATIHHTDMKRGQRCTRDGAEFLLHIFENHPSNSYVLVATRLISRRRNADDDAALIDDVSMALQAAGAVKRA